jgi:hypothetical protein
LDTKLSGFGGWFHLKFHVKGGKRKRKKKKKEEEKKKEKKKKKATLWGKVNETKPMRQ